jgi:5-methylcytosine-specific restriction endonuclease McrA
MNTNILVTASALSDQELLARLEGLAISERETSAELVAHLAALDSRAVLHAAQGYGSLFSYCTQALRLSEDAACNRIEAARACRRFPLILDLLASGSLSLTSIRLLGPHLTVENHESVLARARDRKRREIEALVAELTPRPDIASTVRKVPCRNAMRQPATGSGHAPGPPCATTTRQPSPAPGHEPRPGPWPAPGHAPALAPGSASGPGPLMTSVPSGAAASITPSPSPLPATTRPIVQASAPARYYVRFTIGQETHERLRRLQALLRREIPDGDPGAIFDRAVTVLLEKVEKTKLAAATRPRPSRLIRPETDSNRPIRIEADPSLSICPETHPNRPICLETDPNSSIRPPGRLEPDPNLPIRPAADKEVRKPGVPSRAMPPALPSRHVPREVKREVWRRDAGQCAFASSTGRRCTESTFLEFHHIQPYAKQGPATIANISLRCWRHNHYEGEMIFGSYRPSIAREAPLP